MKKFTFNLKRHLFLALATVFLMLSAFAIPDDSRAFIHTMLNKFYDREGQREGLKRYELNVTNSGFCRFKKVYNSGKEEFFSFNLNRFKCLDYYGNEQAGSLYLRTKSDDVIVQTRNDKKGAVDSMATYVVIPLKNIGAEQLNELSEHFRKINASGLGTY